jgi:hypothetical protein
MPRGDVEVKGRLLLSEGRLIVDVVNGEAVSARCRGDSARVYKLGWHRHGGWHCNCAAIGRCSHTVALQLVTLEPGTRG